MDVLTFGDAVQAHFRSREVRFKGFQPGVLARCVDASVLHGLVHQLHGSCLVGFTFFFLIAIDLGLKRLLVGLQCGVLGLQAVAQGYQAAYRFLYCLIRCGVLQFEQLSDCTHVFSFINVSNDAFQGTVVVQVDALAAPAVVHGQGVVVGPDGADRHLAHGPSGYGGSRLSLQLQGGVVAGFLGPGSHAAHAQETAFHLSGNVGGLRIVGVEHYVHQDAVALLADVLAASDGCVPVVVVVQDDRVLGELR